MPASMPPVLASAPASTAVTWHTPATHVSPLGHANVAPQPPQLLLSACSSTHPELHIV
jgi:hypothetical protein